MPIRWRLLVELTSDVTDGETWEDVVWRVKSELEKIRGEDKHIQHYHIMGKPTKCVELD